MAEALVAEKAANTSDSESNSEEGTSEGTSNGSIVHSILHHVRKKRSRHHLPGSTAAETIPTKSRTDSPLLAAPSSDKKTAPVKHKISEALATLLVYTVGVSCMGLGSQSYVTYRPEHMFSLSENAANRLFKSRTFDVPTPKAEGGEGVIVVETSPASNETRERGAKTGMWELIKHNQSHLTRIYPKGTRVSSSNYQPHRYWAAGAQLAAINWQTFG